MMREIWKFQLEVTDRQVVPMPRVHRLLTVQIQDGKPTLWAAVNPESARVGVVIDCVGSGNPAKVLEHEPVHLGTVQMIPFVWHFFVSGVITGEHN